MLPQYEISTTNNLGTSAGYQILALKAPCALAEMREQQKNTKYKQKLADENIQFLPFVIDFYGGFEESARKNSRV